MTTDQLKQTILSQLTAIAPEADPAHIDARAPLREQLDLDSMDFLNFVIGLHKTLGIDIPEADYAKLSTLEAGTAYLAARLATNERGGGTTPAV